MKVSIIVPVYNVEKYLPKCLDSLVSQTIEDFEITDGTHYKTTFSDGTVVEADVSTLQIWVNGTEVKLSDFEQKGATTD